MLLIPYRVARQSRHLNVLANGSRTWLTHFVGRHVLAGRESPVAGSMDEPADVQSAGVVYPMAHLVEQEAHTEVPPHYHRPAQFQVFVAGRGRIGQHDIVPITVHFAAPFSPYGPIRAEAEGVHYFTLRNGWDPGAQWMPQSRSDLLAARPRVGHAITATRVEPMRSDELRRLRQSTTEVVLNAQGGLDVSIHRIPPHRSWHGPRTESGTGQFRIVTGGAASAVDATGGVCDLEPLSCMFVAPTDDVSPLTASDSGLEVLVLQFPGEAYYEARERRAN